MGFCTVWASAASTTSRGVFVRSAAQSRKLDRNPCGTAAMPSSLVNLVLSKNPIDAVRRADSTLDARRVATFVTAESLY